MPGCQLVQFAESFSRESWVRGKTRNRRLNFRCIADVTGGRYTLIENFIDNSFRDGQVRTTGTDILREVLWAVELCRVVSCAKTPNLRTTWHFTSRRAY